MGKINAAESKESKNIKKLYETLSGLSKGTIDYREAKKNLLNAKKSYERITDRVPMPVMFTREYDSPEIRELSSKILAIEYLYADWVGYVSFFAGFIDEKSNMIVNERYSEGEKVTYESALYNALEWMDALIESKNDIEIQAMKAGLQVREFKIKGYETIP
ncbi:MAG: hypothetical protein E7200_08535 [Selenomonas ruminantium]|nr:hypothetical protein [Selenomonas ruminantium]